MPFVMMADGEKYWHTLYRPGDTIELRLIAAGASPLRRWFRYEQHAEALDWADGMNRDGWNIYAGVNPRIAAGRSSDSGVSMCRALFADFDGKHLAGYGETPALEIVNERIARAGLPAPTITIDSGHGIHVYWVSIEPFDTVDLWRLAIGEAISAIGSDPTCRNPERIMRVPGYLNHKPPVAMAAVVGISSALPRDEIDGHLHCGVPHQPVPAGDAVRRPVRSPRRPRHARLADPAGVCFMPSVRDFMRTQG